LNVISNVNILFISSDLPSFVSRDLKILRERHNVVVRLIHHANPFRFLGDVRTLWKSDLLFVWFASIFTLPLVIIAKLLGKQIVTVVGGYEAANEPELEYGSARSPFRRMLVRWVLILSDQVLAVSHASEGEIQRNLAIASDKIRMLYHGFEDIPMEKNVTRKPVVVNVGHVSEETWMKKGIYDFVLAAEQMSDIQFIHLGNLRIDIAAKLGRPLPSNLKFIGQVPFEQLGQYLSTAKVYLQLSRHESFGCSVAEAMLFRCVPVVSNAAALPEVVGDCGIIVESKETSSDVVNAVRLALAMPDSEGDRARQRVRTHFSYENRRDTLLKVINMLTCK
jgi:glycosyltransferase involved in cell wall biosynthesis